MPSNLTKDIVVLLAGALLTLALETQRKALEDKFGSEATSLLCFLFFLILIAGYIGFRHYLTILSTGKKSEGAIHGKSYLNLRDSLADGGMPARIYAKWLERALHAVENFFRDGSVGGRTYLANAIGLTRQAPLWTAPALERCILLSFIYPQTMIFLMWVVSGRVGPAEIALGLVANKEFWFRAAALMGIVIAAFGYSRSQNLAARIGKGKGEKSRIWKQVALLIPVIFAGAMLTDLLLGKAPGAVGGAVGVTSAIVGAIAGDVIIALASALGGAVAGAVIVSIITVATDATFYGAIAASLVGVAIGLVAAATNLEESPLWTRLRRSGLFLTALLITTVIACLYAAYEISSSGSWPVTGPVILLYGLLSALNAPFVWLSLGLTRALLWLGLERKAWWPYVYALIDAAMAVLVMVLLVIAMIVGVQLLDLVSAGRPVMPLVHATGGAVPLLQGIKDNPAAPEYWWVYTLLLSTMIPSLVNLMIGGWSLTRGLPVLSRYLYAQLPALDPVAHDKRSTIALILTFQSLGGICLGILAQAFLVWGIFGHILPGFGLGILHIAERVAAYDLPGQILRH